MAFQKWLKLLVSIFFVISPHVVHAQVGPCGAGDSCAAGQACLGPADNKQCFITCTPPSDPLASAPECGAQYCTRPSGFTRDVCVNLEGATPISCSDSTPCPGGGTCRGGICVSAESEAEGSADSSGAPSTEEGRPFQSITPNLGVQIPGLALSPAQQQEGGVSVPFLAQYINALYRYAIGIVLVAAIVMVVYGGFRYLVGAGVGGVQRGKEIIRDAIVGMLLVIAAYLILNTLNPATTNLQVLNLDLVEYEGIDFIDESTYRAATGMDNPSREEVRAVVREVAEARGINVCAFDAVAGGESGYRANAIGYDANVPRVGVFSRRAFIKSGRKYSGATFPVPEGTWTGTECRPGSRNLSEAQIAAIQDRSIRNDDRFDPNAPPLFGLDTRFSVGIGAGQVTLLPDSSCSLPRCPNGNLGRNVGGTCYSVPELLQPRPQMEAAAEIYQRADANCSSYRDPYIHQRCIYARYGGSGCSVRVGACRKMKAYAACAGIPHRERDDCRSYLNETDEFCNNYNNT